MKAEVYKCDGCGRIKDEANHWFGVKLFLQLNKVNFAISTFDPIKFENEWEHFCGEECLLKMVARNLPK